MATDPRTRITPTAFTVAPEILGYALARPVRRLAAIGVDFVLVSIIAGTPVEFLVAAAVALLAWRAIAGPAERLLAGRGRFLFRGASAVLALFVVLNIWNAASERIQLDFNGSDADEEEVGAAAATAEDGDVEIALDDLDLSPPEKATFLIDVAALQMAKGDAATERSQELGRWLLTHTDSGQQRTQLAQVLAGMMEPAARTAFNRELGADSVAAAPPGDSLALVRTDNARLRARNEHLAERVEELEERRMGMRAFLSGITDDLGLGFGWFALYFTAFGVLGRGQTPGKWLLRIKVLRLDNRPLGWWASFERFGGYAASFSTGLLGFAQILWDANRQALHDKAVGTVVIRLRDGQPFRVP
jgi:hypothetical protein